MMIAPPRFWDASQSRFAIWLGNVCSRAGAAWIQAAPGRHVVLSGRVLSVGISNQPCGPFL